MIEEEVNEVKPVQVSFVINNSLKNSSNNGIHINNNFISSNHLNINYQIEGNKNSRTEIRNKTIISQGKISKSYKKKSDNTNLPKVNINENNEEIKNKNKSMDKNSEKKKK